MTEPFPSSSFPPDGTSIPDAVPADLADLLRAKLGGPANPLPTIPQVQFSKDYPGELPLLMVALLHNSIGEKPDHRSFVLLAASTVASLHDTYREMCERAVQEDADHATISVLSQLVAGFGLARYIVDGALATYSHMFDFKRGKHSVSDEFIQSIGMDRAEFTQWITDKASS